nr:MAG TPA: hypothetical protein [Crassvirales sp.]DAU16035.1 MAG TPA: hypothetical protein [Caudoviricetes sp.]
MQIKLKYRSYANKQTTRITRLTGTRKSFKSPV